MTNTDALFSIIDEAVLHAGRHGFEPMEEADAWCFTGTGGWEAIFRALSWSRGMVSVEVIRYSKSRSLCELRVADYMGGMHPDAVFLDLVEEALVEAKGRVVAASA